MPFGLLRFTRAWGAALALSTPTGCVGFIQPTAVTVSHEGTPTPPKPPREGYLRIWTTTNFAGLYTSWKDGSSRAKFKKLLVTIEVAGSGQEIPVLSLDITGQQPEAKNLIDEELDSYIGAYQAAHAILTTGGVSQLVAFSRWLAHGGESLRNSAAVPASPAPVVETWSVVNVRRSALKACLLPALTSVDVALRYSDASKLKGLAAADATTPEKLYEVVSALDLVLGGEEPPPTADADVGQLKRQRGMFERRLYKEVFETVKTQAELARVLDTYPRCELCVVQGRKKRDSLAPSPAPGPRTIPVVEAPTIDASLAALNIDPTPLANARSSLARVMLLEEAGKSSAPDLASARTAWKQDAAAAEKLLIEEVKVSPAAAAEFIRYE